ncbi:MAG: serine/threonine protein kinase [Myxococcales bacterium]|jgi:serine/threonine protein kinase|nr:serine/threonine protein kinase [Myxococcales bacterium]MBL0196781.1 serine/threonine protein kinase [Myxococcales bacterium]
MHPGTLRDLAVARVGRAYAGKWTIESLIDMGGMAAVYAGTHRNGKRVALKVLHEHIAKDPDLRARFLREGYVANLIEHPGAVQILDDHDDPVHNEVLLVMELLEGQSIDRWLKGSGGTMPMTDALAVGFQVLDVLEAFHEAGVVHRDIKPGNLFVTRAGVVKVLDFGLARLKDRSLGKATGVGTVLGTASYIPPEQAQGLPDRIDARSDLFAVGAVLFHMLSGFVVHEGRSSVDRLFSAMRTPPRPLLSLAPRVPPEIGDVVDKALSFERDGRYDSAREMRDALRAAYLAVFRAPVARPVAHSKLEGFDEAFAEPSAVVEVSFGPPPTTRPER